MDTHQTHYQLLVVCHKDQSWPPLFLLYMNDLPNVPKVLQFCLFADDTSIYFDANELTMLQKVVNRELRKVRTTEFTRLPGPLTCLDGLHCMLNLNMSLVFYEPPVNVYPGQAREQCYHVTNFDMIKFNTYGKLT